MRNRIEKLGSFEDIETKHNVIKLLSVIKQQMFDGNELKHSSLWMVRAWRKLLTCRQNEDEDLIDHYRGSLVWCRQLRLGFISFRSSGQSFTVMFNMKKVQWLPLPLTPPPPPPLPSPLLLPLPLLPPPPPLPLLPPLPLQ